MPDSATSQALAAGITKAASKPTDLIIRFLVDRDRVADAYRAYAYFRWLDDQLDQGEQEKAACLAFVGQQQRLVEACYRGERPGHLTAEEQLLVELIQSDPAQSSGLYTYIGNMMAVMAFDAERKGRLISQAELNHYSRCLAVAVTEALHYFIGRGTHSPQGGSRYLAATAAHISHMLRDTQEDVAAGYFNVPRPFLDSYGIGPAQIETVPYQMWVERRVRQARSYFQAGQSYLTGVESPRCRLAARLYMRRFARTLDQIEQDGYWV